ncbi:RHS repeat-associated core domain-containing protein [Spirochaeta cellobiosiphila]|uniref:RHS repeat-associated core domain-containing protein n=1 Tax=Spirochaeta cellobiosiphila TaxID=504483 RepID=UPI00042893E0|nr:RHS repeat-associated core domain-containing protein [Spirochaeta cellobiosiphila]
MRKAFYCQDGLGSISSLFNSLGFESESYDYDAFGQAINGSFVGQNQMGYNGKRVDSFTGKYDYGFRDYDPMRMRWTTIDPIKDGSNWYVYVRNNPINFIDLWRLSATTENDGIQIDSQTAIQVGAQVGANIIESELNHVKNIIDPSRNIVQKGIEANLINLDLHTQNIDDTMEILEGTGSKTTNFPEQIQVIILMCMSISLYLQQLRDL